MTDDPKHKAGEAAGDALQAVDNVVAEAALPIQDALPVRLLGSLSEAGDQPQLRLLSGALIAAGLLARNGRLARAGLRMILAHELATAAKNFVKLRVDRTRPRSVGENQDGPKLKPGRNTDKEETSFPSGHSAGATAVARAYIREYPEHAAPAYAAATGVALAQIPRCAHYPTDVGAGIVIGAAAEAVVDGGWRLLVGAAERA